MKSLHGVSDQTGVDTRHMILRKLFKRLYVSFGALAWPAFVAMVIFHAWVTYIGLLVFGEDDLTQPIDFIYFYFTSASTVGYGDLSPQTDGGRIFATIWLFPGALIFFTVYLTKLTQIISNGWRKICKGGQDAKTRTHHQIFQRRI